MSAGAATANDRRPAPLPGWLQRMKWTAIPDAYSDNVEPYLRPAERSLMRLLFQRTVGNPSYGRKERPQHVDLSQNEIAAAIGVKHKNTISRATKLLVELGLAKVVSIGRRYRYVLGEENAEAMRNLEPDVVMRTVRRYVDEEAAAKERREAAKAAQEIVEEAADGAEARVEASEPKAALRIVAATEPLVMMPGETLRPLSEVCANCNLASGRRNSESFYGTPKGAAADSTRVASWNVSPDCDNHSPFIRQPRSAEVSARTNSEGALAISEVGDVDSTGVAGWNVSPDCDNHSPFIRSGPLGCPPDEVWDQVATGFARQDRAEAFAEHAAKCDPCARKLRDAIAIFRNPEPESTGEQLKAALRMKIPPVAFENWIAPATFKVNGSVERPVLTVQAHATEVNWIQAEYPVLLQSELARLGISDAEIRFEVKEEPAPASPPRPALPSDEVAQAYLQTVRTLIDQHRVEERLGQVLDSKFVADQVARVCVPVAHIERAFAEKARKFTKPGFLVNIFDDAISYSRQALRQAVLTPADSERAYEGA